MDDDEENFEEPRNLTELELALAAGGEETPAW
jgi:hypothetical protein